MSFATLMPQPVAIVVVTWNSRRDIERCLGAAAREDPLEVVVVDNGSSDGSAEWVAAQYPQVRLLRNDHNAGFSVANNQGIAVTSAQYVALLNNDAAPEPTWLANIVTAMESDPSVGMCAAQILRWGQRDTIDSMGIAPDRSGTFWQLENGLPRADAPSAPRPVFGASGAACLYRRSMLDDIGGLDEDYFAYLEDADLAWRAQLAGWRCLCVPTAVVYHRHSATAGQGSPLKGYHLGRNKWWTIIKDYPAPAILWNLPVVVGRDLLAVSYHMIIHRDLYPLRGRLAALRTLGAVLRKRRAVQRRATAEGMREAWTLRHPLFA
jgi:GT2 family glycosyltransferase